MIGDDLGPLLLATGLSLGILGALTWLWARAKSTENKLPSGNIIYSDHGTWLKQEDPLYSPELDLVGKPDYLVRQANGLIVPVELKSTDAPPQPYDGHILQLAAYCLLVEESYDQRPAYGILQYRDKAFAVEYTIDLEEDLLDLLAEMRADLFVGDVNRDHESWLKCSRCGMRERCSQRLA